jgi:hypothetical protein
MAQTKTSRAGSSRASRQGSSGRSGAKSNRARSSSSGPTGAKGTRARSSSGGSGAKGTRARSTSSSPANGEGRTAAVTKAVGNGARSTVGALLRAAGKAKVPLMAGGAALAGLAGGAALAQRNQRGKKVLGVPVPRGVSMPRVRNGGSTAKALGDAAIEVGKAGYRVGELTAEVRKVREQMTSK